MHCFLTSLLSSITEHRSSTAFPSYYGRGLKCCHCFLIGQFKQKTVHEMQIATLYTSPLQVNHSFSFIIILVFHLKENTNENHKLALGGLDGG